MARRLQARIDYQMGSGWSLKRVVGLLKNNIHTETIKGVFLHSDTRRLMQSEVGLDYIKNEDQECFQYCMLYHQSDKAKNADRTTVLNRIEDKYNWGNVNSPATFDDITTFETNNRVCSNIFAHDLTKNKINPIRLGHIPFIRNGNINLLLIKDEADNGHYLYIKKLKPITHCLKFALQGQTPLPHLQESDRQERDLRGPHDAETL